MTSSDQSDTGRKKIHQGLRDTLKFWYVLFLVGPILLALAHLYFIIEERAPRIARYLETFSEHLYRALTWPVGGPPEETKIEGGFFDV